MLKYVLKRIKIVRMKNIIEKLDESKNTLMWNCHGCENMNFEKKVKNFKFQISKIIQSIKIGNL